MSDVLRQSEDLGGNRPSSPDVGPEPGAPPPPAPEFPSRNYGAGGIQAFKPMPQPTPDPRDEALRRQVIRGYRGDINGRLSRLRPEQVQQFYLLQRQRDLSHAPGDPDAPTDAELLDTIEAQVGATFRGALRGLAPIPPMPVLHFGLGLGEGVVATIRKTEPPDFGSPFEAIGYGLMSPMDPNDPLTAAGMAFPPASSIGRGLEMAGQMSPKLAPLALREARFAAAQSRYMPDFARLRVAGIPEAAGAASEAPLLALPEKTPAGVAHHLQQAAALVERQQPGAFTKILHAVPGGKQATEHFVPALGQKPQITVSWVGQGRAEVTTGARLALERQAILSRVDSVFGKGASTTAMFRPAGVQFIGTEAERAANPVVDATGTLIDIVERPMLYDMTPAQRQVINDAGQQRLAALLREKQDFGLDVRPYPLEPGGMHIRHVDISEVAKKISGGEQAALERGAVKERFHPTLAERLQADPTYEPNSTLSQLLAADDENLARQAGERTFVVGSGGLTRKEVIAKIKPELAAKMDAAEGKLWSVKSAADRLGGKQGAVIDDFLASPQEDEDIGTLLADLNPTVGPDAVGRQGRNFGKDLKALRTEINGAKADLTALREEWRTANTKPYGLVKENVNRYYHVDDLDAVRRLLERSNSPLLKFIDELRATAFGGDLSPITIQGLQAWLADPVATSKSAWGQKLGGVSLEALHADMQANPETWTRFIEFTGVNPLGGLDQEFATGFLSKIPKVGKVWERFNEDLYRPLMRLQKDMFDSSYEGALQLGKTTDEAGAIAAHDAMTLIPRQDYRLLGQSQAQAARYRAALTSVSFLTQPAALMSDATKGLIKLGLKQTLTLNEKFAVKRMLTLAATTEAIAVASNTLYARSHGLSENQAIKDSLDPNSGVFMSLRLPNGGKIGLGGPYRSLIKGIVPGQIGGQGPYIPFAGLPNFAQGKIGPGLRIAWDEAQRGGGRDYYGNQIRTGDESLKGFFVNVLQGTAYVFQGYAPLTVGTTIQTVRKGQPLSETATAALTQFAGTNYQPESLRSLENRVAAQMFPIDPKTEPWRQQEPYLGLKPAQQEKVRQDPLVKEQWEAQQHYQGKSFEAWRGAEAQFQDTVRQANDSADAAYKDLAQRRQDTADRKLKADNPKALSPEQFREAIKNTARTRRGTVMAATAAWDKTAKDHPQPKDFEELNPDAALREKFLAEYSNPDYLDPTTLAWNYSIRDYSQSRWEQMYGKETVQRWLREGSEGIPPLVQRYWDGLEKYRAYFQVRDDALSHMPQNIRLELLALDEAEVQRKEPGFVEALKRMAPPEVGQWNQAIKDAKQAMRAANPDLDRWLFDYGYTPSTMAEQIARKETR